MLDVEASSEQGDDPAAPRVHQQLIWRRRQNQGAPVSSHSRKPVRDDPAGRSGHGPFLTVPAYFLPEARDCWARLVAAGPAVGSVILNRKNGPGSGPAVEYRGIVAACLEVGQDVLGYVWTDYGARDWGRVLGDIDRYRTFYGVRQIFLDGASAHLSRLPVYRGYFAAIGESGGSTVLNPGIVPPSAYGECADAIVVFEGTASVYLTHGWRTSMHQIPVATWHLVYDAPPAIVADVLRLAGLRGASGIYVTDRGLPNPWDTLPSYWEDEVNMIRSGHGLP